MKLRGLVWRVSACRGSGCVIRWACFSSHSTRWFGLRIVGGEGSVFANLGRTMNLEFCVDSLGAFPRIAGLVALLVGMFFVALNALV